MMVLVDTSVWIDFFSGTDAFHVDALDRLTLEADLCVCGVILTEILQGVRRDRDHSRTKKYFEELIYLPMSRATFVNAADIYRTLRRKGITIRKPVDCMIASVALEHDVRLLHNDRDFDPVEKHFGLEVHRPSGEPPAPL